MSRPDRYDGVAAGLHWLIAILILGMVAGGFNLENEALPQSLRFQMFQLHKSIGITILGLTLLRLVWRLTHRPPPLPDSGQSAWQKRLALATHWGFYILLVAIPLSGWAMVSASPLGIPTVLYGVIPWPHLPVEMSQPAYERFYETHEALVKLTLALLALHVGAALYHHYKLRDGLIRRMWPFGARS